MLLAYNLWASYCITTEKKAVFYECKRYLSQGYDISTLGHSCHLYLSLYVILYINEFLKLVLYDVYIIQSFPLNTKRDEYCNHHTASCVNIRGSSKFAKWIACLYKLWKFVYRTYFFTNESQMCQEGKKLKRPIMRVKECVSYWHTALHSHIPHTLLHHALNQDCNNCISKIIAARVYSWYISAMKTHW